MSSHSSRRSASSSVRSAASVSSLSLVFSTASGGECERNRSDNEENAYDEDEFEDELPPANQSMDAFGVEDYSDDQFEDAEVSGSDLYADESFEDEQNVAPANEMSQNGDDHVTTTGADSELDEHEHAAQSAHDSFCSEDAMELNRSKIPSEWISQTMQSLLGKVKRARTASASRKSSSSSLQLPTMPFDAFTKLQTRIQSAARHLQSDPLHDAAAAAVCRPTPSQTGAQIPRACIDKLMNKAKVERFLSMRVGGASQDCCHASALRESLSETPIEQQKPLSSSKLQTFCSVKQARLEGELATLRMQDAWRRHYAGENESTGHAMSVATLEFMHDMTVAQRKIVCVGNALDCSSLEHRASKTIESTAVMAQACLEESRMLVRRANRLLLSANHAQRPTATN